jgi:hypothetical protein
MITLVDYPLLLVFVLSLVLIGAAIEVGHWLGQRVGDHGAGNNVATLKASILGLLALMIGFTFAMAQTRFDVRRDAILSEANAIGTTALRARLLPSPHNRECLSLLRDYVAIQLEAIRQNPLPLDSMARSNVVQEKLWQQAKAVASKDNAMVPTGLFIQALNDMIDSEGKRVAASRSRVPNSVLLTLYAIAAIAIGFASYGRALEGRHWRPALYVTGILTACVILLIQDLDRPSSGFITVSQQSMVDVATSLARYAD